MTQGGDNPAVYSRGETVYPVLGTSTLEGPRPIGGHP